MKVAIMQPYFFPYIGYFQLINVVDKFVFYDDVNFIKNGWINRNRILLDGEPHYITVQLRNASPNKLINEVEFTDNRIKLIKTLEYSYKRAPLFSSIMPVLIDCLTVKTNNISELAQYSVTRICNFLDLEKDFEVSSKKYSNTRGFEKAERLQQICLLNKSGSYYNLIGGLDLYNKFQFSEKKINLYYIQSRSIDYKQYNNEFVPWLSIIDLLMFNEKEMVKDFLNNYTII
jgi:hypothetical protein